MNEEIKERWVAALRSGQYTQGHGNLCVVEPGGQFRHCCLGVLSEVAGVMPNRTSQMIPPNRRPSREVLDFFYPDQEQDGLDFGITIVPPDRFMKSLGINTTQTIELWTMNDGDNLENRTRKSFSEIADWIEENL